MLSNGRVMGPYSTEAVLKLISEGALGGEERIRKSPGGQWIPISKEADFYDRLLEALHEGTNKPQPQLAETMAQETVIVQLPTEALVPPLDPALQPVPEMEGNFEETAVLDHKLAKLNHLLKPVDSPSEKPAGSSLPVPAAATAANAGPSNLPGSPSNSMISPS